VRTWATGEGEALTRVSLPVRHLLDELDPGWRRACGVGKET
jgi:hypothetical protein